MTEEQKATKICPFCSEEIPVKALKCPSCNEKLYKECPFCGEKINLNAIKCKHCGERLDKEKTGKSWVKTYFLCCIFGILGVHNFYNGKVGIGLAQLFTLGGLGIWCFIDIILILTNKYRDFEGRKLSKKITKTSTALLCFFCGSGGMHRFYTEKFGSAWVMFALSYISGILLFATGVPFIIIPLIWALVDFIMILCGSFKDANGKLIKE